MKGIYIYCISSGIGRSDTKKLDGVDFGESVFAFPYKDIRMVAGNVKEDSFKENDLREKMRKDSEWAIRNIALHHDVIANIAHDGTVIPMKFGIVLKNKRSALKILKEFYPQFKRMLLKLEGRSEWGVKLYANYEKAIQKIRKLEKVSHAYSPGWDWYWEKKQEEEIKERVEIAIEEKLEKILVMLKRYSPEIAVSDILSPAFSRHEGTLVFNCSILIKNNLIDDFKNEVFLMKETLEESGLSIEISGPWPPYSFVEIKDNKKEKTHEEE